MSDNLISPGVGVTSGADLLASYYNLWREVYGDATAGTVSRVQIGNNFASLIIKPPVTAVPIALNPPLTVAGTPWVQPVLNPALTTQQGAVFKASIENVIPPSATFAGNWSGGGGVVNGRVLVANSSNDAGYGYGTQYTTCDNGETWQLRYTPMLSGRTVVRWLAAANGTKFCLVDYYTGRTITSTNGEDWTEGNSVGFVNPYQVVSNNVNFLVVGAANSAVSSGGVTWSTASVGAGLTVYPPVWNGSVYLGGQNIPQASSDGLVWVSRDLMLYWEWASWNKTVGGNGKFVRSATYYADPTWCKIAVSTDQGVTWVYTDAPTASAWKILFHDGIKFWAKTSGNAGNGYVGYVGTSVDGLAWTIYQSDFMKWMTPEVNLLFSGQYLGINYTGETYLSANGSVATIGTLHSAGSTTLIPITQADINVINAQMLPGEPFFSFVVETDKDLLARGGIGELTAPPLPFTTTAAMDALTAPPLPFESDACIVERTSTTEVAVFSAAQVNHIGQQFEIRG